MLFIPGSLIVHMLVASVVGLGWALVSITLTGVTKPGHRAALYVGALLAPVLGFVTHIFLPHDCGFSDFGRIGHIACYTGSWLGDVGVLLVASGAICVLSQSLVSWLGYVKAVRRAVPVSKMVEQEDECARRANAALHLISQTARIRTPGLLLTEENGVCCVVGIFRPSLLLSRSLCSVLEDDELSAVLAHEVGHIRRHDNAVGLAGALSRALAFFSPAMHIALKKYMGERELACDDFAVEVTGDSLALASGVIKVWRQQQPAGQAAAVANLGGGALSDRLKRLINTEPEKMLPSASSKFLAVSAIVLGLAVLALC